MTAEGVVAARGRQSLKRKIVLLAALTMLAGLLPVTSARAATTYDIQVGRGFGRDFPGFSARFYPPEVKVHKGDTLNFNSPVFVLPSGTTPEQFLADNAALSAQYNLLMADPDDGELATKLNPSFIQFLECGAVDNPCSYNGNGDILNPGFFYEGPLAVTIDANPGDVLYGIGIPWSPQSIRIEVVGPNDTASTPEELAATAKELKQQDKAAATALLDQYAHMDKTFTTDENGHKVWDAYAGVDSGPISLLAMFPANLNVKKGDSVQFHFDLTNEVHSATMPIKKAKKQAFKMFGLFCDPDGDQGAGPDGPPQTEAPPFCNDPTQLEIDMGNTAPKGDQTMDSLGEYQDSGWKGYDAGDGSYLNTDPWTVQFNAKTGDTPIKYICTFHGPFMKGAISVK
jgi:plastocyanin